MAPAVQGYLEKMLKLLFLLLPYLSLTAARAILYPLPYYQARTFDHDDSLEELFNNTELISLPDWQLQWPEHTLPVHFFMEIGKNVHNIILFLQRPTKWLFNGIPGSFQQRKKPTAYSSPYSFFKPLGNFSFTFGISLNFDTTGSIGFSRIHTLEYNVAS